MTAPRPGRRVFVSHAYVDAERADAVRRALQASGLTVTDATVSPGEDLRQTLADSIRTSDIVVVLLSEAASHSRWALWEQRRASSPELDARGVAVIPARLDAADVPDRLAGHQVIDLSANFDSGLRRLVDQVRVTTLIDFSALSPEAFERLVADVLTALGFAVDADPAPDRRAADMTARLDRTDPLSIGATQTETWLVECKLYRRDRVSVASIRQLVGLLAAAPTGTRGLLVTSGQLTSVAREFLVELQASARVQVRVIDGVELTRLLQRYPAIVSTYFGRPPRGHDADS